VRPTDQGAKFDAESAAAADRDRSPMDTAPGNPPASAISELSADLAEYPHALARRADART